MEGEPKRRDVDFEIEQNCKRAQEAFDKLAKSEERVDELEQALRESVMVAIDRDLEVNAGRLDAEEKVCRTLGFYLNKKEHCFL